MEPMIIGTTVAVAVTVTVIHVAVTTAAVTIAAIAATYQHFEKKGKTFPLLWSSSKQGPREEKEYEFMPMTYDHRITLHAGKGEVKFAPLALSSIHIFKSANRKSKSSSIELNLKT